MTISLENFNGPSLISPNGGEVIFSRTTSITWEQTQLPTVTDIYWFEILFTDSYDAQKDFEWKQIGIVPYGSTAMTWRVPYSVKSSKCRIGIRARNQEGKRTKLSISAANFSIQDKPLRPPAILTPVDGEQYFSFVPITLDHAAIIGTSSERAYYQIYYKSESKSIDWTLLRDNVRVGSKTVYWDIREFASANDYEIKVQLIDGNNISLPTFVSDLKVDALNYFVIDTTAPLGTLAIQNNQQYTKERDVVLSLTAYDETSGVETVTLEEVDEKSNTVTSHPKQPYSNVTTFHIQGDDGVKFIRAKFSDYGGNIPVDDATQKYFREYFGIAGKYVTSMLIYNNAGTYEIWSAFSEPQPKLYRDRQSVSDLGNEATSMRFYDNILYVALKSDSNTGYIQRWSGGILSTIESFSDYDSVVESMAVFDSLLWIGMQNGDLYSFNGTIFELQRDFSNRIINIYATESSLFIFQENTTDIVVMTELSGSYVFSTVSV